jgi:hypothetical protein
VLETAPPHRGGLAGFLHSFSRSSLLDEDTGRGGRS